MIHYIFGKIISKNINELVVENHGIGYNIYVSDTDLDKFQINSEARVHTFLHASDKGVKLYGFINEEQLESFLVLNNITGIGPKIATNLSSLGSLEEIIEILEKGDLPPQAKGIGKKRLQKILLELTGKIKEVKKKGVVIIKDEAYQALISLGFSAQETKNVLSKIPNNLKEPQERIKEALKLMGK